MSEASETQPKIATKNKEAPAITLTETVTGIALKTLIPSAAHGREELDKYRRYKFLHSMGSVAEIAGIGMTVGGQEMGPAMYVAGKLTAWIAEERAYVKEARKIKKARRKARGDTSVDVPPMPAGGIEGETEIIRLPSRMVGVAAKVLMPSFLSAGQIEKKGYRIMVQSAKAAEILGPAVGIAMGDPELAGGAYVGAKTLALFAEAADRVLPKAKDKLKVLKEKDWLFVKRVEGKLKAGIGSAAGGAARGAGRFRGAVGQVVGRAREEAGPVLREAVSSTKKELGQAREAARQKLGDLKQKKKEPENLSRSQKRRKARNSKKRK